MSSHSPSATPSESGSPEPCNNENLLVSANDVRCIMADIPASITDEQILCFITAAHVVIQNEIIADDDCNVDDCTLKTIEQWLAAHFVATIQPDLIMERYGDGQDNAAGLWGLGFDGSRYGQQVMRIDPCGKLSEINGKAKMVTRPLIFQVRGR